MPVDSKAKGVSRRRFLKGGAVAAGAATATVAFPQVSRAETTTLKMQASWGAKSVFSDMARQYVKRVDEMSGGRLKIDFLPAGAVVKAFQVQGRLPQARTRRRPHGDGLLVRKEQGRLAVRHRPGVRLQRRADPVLDPFRRRQGALSRARPGYSEAELGRLLLHADADAAARLVHRTDQERRSAQGPEIPHRRPGHRHHAGHRRQGDPASGR